MNNNSNSFHFNNLTNFRISSRKLSLNSLLFQLEMLCSGCQIKFASFCILFECALNINCHSILMQCFVKLNYADAFNWKMDKYNLIIDLGFNISNFVVISTLLFHTSDCGSFQVCVNQLYLLMLMLSCLT